VSSLIKSFRQVGGVSRGGFPWWLLNQQKSRKALVLVSEEEDAVGLADDLRAFAKLPSEWGLKWAPEVMSYPEDDEPARQVALFEWLFGKAEILVASRQGLELPCDSGPALQDRVFVLRPGLNMSRRQFEERMASGGYSRNDRAEQVGEYSIRGEVVDIWPPQLEAPIRIAWSFDTIESLRTIEIHSQRSEEFRTEVAVYPVTAGTSSRLSDVVLPDTNIYFTGSDFKPEQWPENLKDVTWVSPQPGSDGDAGLGPPPLFVGHLDRLREQLISWHEDDWRTAIFCHNRGEKERLEELLEDSISRAKGGRPEWMPELLIGELEHGFVQSQHRLAVLANSEIFGRYRKRVRLPRFEAGSALSSPLDIKAGDYLVHEKHGIGRYVGLRPLKVGGIMSEFLTLEYKGGDKLYVPVFEIQQVQKYLGAEGRRPALSSLDTAAWERVKSKVKEDVAKLAAELLRKAAKRTIRPGFSFPHRTRLEEEFSASFIYELTTDQQKTLQEVEDDMMSPKAMDRLICGDVGYGKTEVAMRAALKAALASKQVCFLCPTTILAEQHARTFSERFADYPVSIRLLSRFQDKPEQKEIIDQLARGGVDVVIGTHRLLSKDIHFKDLGLLVIDEEHRFGVRQKGKLLSMRETVDVLSLTATPIPRTLASALGGIKDLSVIETAPAGRLPISTHVGLFDEDLMVKAVQGELDRGGQVFYVHNRVKTLLARKEWIQSVLPGIRIAMAHGQMSEDELEKAMHDFVHKKVDLLLATTIIESGLDIPSVNTLIIEEAEEMGLSQLYQLRGRVGRSKTRAYCYLFYATPSMSTDAKKRLEALKEFTSLGSGLRLAMRDMEIRGAGNLLGSQQHGNMAAVGIETYTRLLNEEIQRVKGEPVEDAGAGPVIELSISAYIPDDYLPAEAERIQMYKRILSAREPDLVKLTEELVDRCGPLPAPAKTLLQTATLRLQAKKHGITEVHEEAESLLVRFREGSRLPDRSFEALVSQKDRTLELIPGNQTGVRVRLQPAEGQLEALSRFLTSIFPA